MKTGPLKDQKYDQLDLQTSRSTLSLYDCSDFQQGLELIGESAR